MEKQCPICKRKYIWVWRRRKLRGKYNPTVKRKQKLNLQPFKLPSGKRIMACTKCIKTLSKQK